MLKLIIFLINVTYFPDSVWNICGAYISNYIAKSQSGKKFKGSCSDSLWWSISDFSLQYEYIDK